MPRYFFSIFGAAGIADDDGEILADDHLAKHATLEILTQTLPGQASRLLSGTPCGVEATAEGGRLVCRITVQAGTERPD